MSRPDHAPRKAQVSNVIKLAKLAQAQVLNVIKLAKLSIHRMIYFKFTSRFICLKVF